MQKQNFKMHLLIGKWKIYNMKRILILFMGLLFLQCSTPKLTPKYIDSSFASIKQVMKQQEIDWNNGDLEGFMEGYWKSDSLKFIGSRGINKGWQATLDSYKKGYPDKKTMGTLQFEVIKLEALSPTVCHMIGRYTLIRENDKPSGVFTLVWKLIDGKWVIVIDQTC